MSKLYKFIKNSEFFRLRGSYKNIFTLDRLDYFGMSVQGELLKTNMIKKHMN
jgi:hypothetical protein